MVKYQRTRSVILLIAVNLAVAAVSAFLLLLSLGYLSEIREGFDRDYGIGKIFYTYADFSGAAPFLIKLFGAMFCLHLLLSIIQFFRWGAGWSLQALGGLAYLILSLGSLLIDMRQLIAGQSPNFLGAYGLALGFIMLVFAVVPGVQQYFGRFNFRD